MIDDDTKKEILNLILEESVRIKYGKIIVIYNVVDSNVVDMEAETKRRKKFNN